MNGGKQAMPLLGFSSPGATALHARNVRSRKPGSHGHNDAHAHKRTHKRTGQYRSIRRSELSPACGGLGFPAALR